MTVPWLHPTAAYIHVPFCAHHCGYCDFAVVAGQDQLMDSYLDALAAEMATLKEPKPVRTIFIGGGTPTYLDARRLERLLDGINRWLPLENADIREFSIETTPESLDAEKVAIMAGHGVNRVSIGAQSFQTHHLQTLERIHNPDDVPRAVECVRPAIPQISLDLIFGVPGQTLGEWETDIRRALTLAPNHLATYGLTYEKGTRLWKQRERGLLRALDEDSELLLYEHTMELLEFEGFEHYEISNFARPGCRSLHNQVYWANEAYYGFGVGAARYVEGRRELNTRDVKQYIKRTLAGESPTFQSEMLEPRERARETMAIQLRRADGILRQSFRLQTDYDLDEIAGPAIARHVDLGLLQDDGVTVQLTRQGKCVADGIVCELLK